MKDLSQPTDACVLNRILTPLPTTAANHRPASKLSPGQGIRRVLCPPYVLRAVNWVATRLPFRDAAQRLPLPMPAECFFNDTANTEIYTLSLHDALPIFTPLPTTAATHRPASRLIPGQWM